jgi:hypothetical protein
LGALLIMMSPVAETVMRRKPAVLAAGLAEAGAEAEAGAGAASTGSCHSGPGPDPRCANATPPSPIPAKTASAMVTVRTGRPKRPGLWDGGWEFIDGDDTFG